MYGSAGDIKKVKQIIEASNRPDNCEVRDVIKKAALKKGLTLSEVGILSNLKEPSLIIELFNTAARIKREIYGDRIVFFAPLYISDFCVNNCLYCNFHSKNQASRKKLSLKEIAAQTEILIKMGHKRVLLEAGESPKADIDYITRAIKTIYSVKVKNERIRRINVNIAATSVENYKKLKLGGIGTYQLFQETYHPETYRKLHIGPKADYRRQISAYDRAFQAGLDDIGLGVLFGLYDWRFEVLSLIAHSQYLEKKYGVGPHTISVPRFCPAPDVSYKPRYEVSDDDFFKIIAIIRLAVPYAGMIISTRESAEIRRMAFNLGISQASAASVTIVGGYGQKSGEPQFLTSDDRILSDVIEDVIKGGFLPSFCTACYRKSRTGRNFMNLAKPAQIHKYCLPNGILSFAEYLEEFASGESYNDGQKIIRQQIALIDEPELRKKTKSYLEKIILGYRDLFF